LDQQPVAEGAGLTTAEAERRLLHDGGNAIADVAGHPIRHALKALWAPVPWMLEAAILLQLLLGKWPEAAVVAALLLFNAALGLFQESRAQATLAALRSRLALVATVRRDGAWTTAAASRLVAADVVKLSLGGVVAADVRLISGSILLDQSMLTGESIPADAGPGAEAYAGALVRRGEAVAVVVATGERTKFGRTAELVRTAKAESSQQKAVLRVVRNLVMFNGTVTVFLAGYAYWLQLPALEIVSLVLVAVLSSIPVALPSMFTLAAAIGARSLGRRGVLPTRLAAVEEAGGIDVLCSDKTGTLTMNALAVADIQAMPGFDAAHVLGLAALASSDAGQDPVDTAIQAASAKAPVTDGPMLLTFIPFDPTQKRAEARVRQGDGTVWQVSKGAYSVIAGLCQASPGSAASADALQAKGYRVLAVAAGLVGHPALVGLIALSDPPRPDSAALVAELKTLGVRTLMVTGDAKVTAEVVSASVGIAGPVWVPTPAAPTLTDAVPSSDFGVFAGVLPEDKAHLVSALQKAGHIVGMCGDGANDAPALRQAQMGIAVSTATDVAKSAAGIVLTQPGLSGIVATVREGRMTFQRVLTYALRSIVHKVVQVLFLFAGLVITGQPILTPTLMVLMMVVGDVLAMSSSTDNVRPSPLPNRWRIGRLTIAGIAMGAADLVFCIACLMVGKAGLAAGQMQTLAVVTLVFSGQAVFYVSRERQHLWSSRPGIWLMISSVVNIGLICVLAGRGYLMPALPLGLLAGVLLAASAFAFVLDTIKLAAFRRLGIA
jgi:H+-transporting ATPase